MFDLPSASRTARGRSLANLVQMNQDESARAILPVRQFEETFVFFATANATGVFWSVMGAETLLAVVSILVFRRGTWKHREV